MAPAVCGAMSTTESGVVGTLALMGGGEWGEVPRALDLLCWPRAERPRFWCCRPQRPSSTPNRSSSRRRVLRQLGAAAATLPVLHRTEAEEPRTSVRPSRGRGSSTSPTARPCTCGRSSRDPRSSRRCSPPTAAARCWRLPAPVPRCCATRWSTPAAVRTPSGSASSEGWRSSRTTAVLRTISANGRSTSSRHAILAGIDEETALLREPGPGGPSPARGGHAVLRRQERAAPRAGSKGARAALRRYDSVIVILSDQHLLGVGAPSPLSGANEAIFFATAMPFVTSPNRA